MAIDLNRCVGCQACATACKIANNLPKAITYNTVYTKTDTDPDTFGTAVVHGAIANDSAGGEWPNCTLSFLPVQCQHCDNPSCLAVCPTGATKKREDGIVWVDNSLCIGCRACIMACPYDNVRSFVEGEPEYYLDVVVGEADAPTHEAGTVEKCTFCHNLIDRGEVPACSCVWRAPASGAISTTPSPTSARPSKAARIASCVRARVRPRTSSTWSNHDVYPLMSQGPFAGPAVFADA